MRKECLEINGTKHDVYIYYEERTNATASIRRTRIIIRIPLAMNREEQFHQILQFKVWAKNKLLQNPEKFKPTVRKQYNDGDVLKVGEEEYNLHINFREKQSSSARIINKDIYLIVSSTLSQERQSKHVSVLLSRIMGRKRLPKLKENIEAINRQHFSQILNKIFFKNNKSNFGSCSKLGNINISTQLLFAPDDVLEYICIHELAHLIEFNHSEQFWLLVEKAMPNYKEKEEWLDKNKHILGF